MATVTHGYNFSLSTTTQAETKTNLFFVFFLRGAVIFFIVFRAGEGVHVSYIAWYGEKKQQKKQREEVVFFFLGVCMSSGGVYAYVCV